MSAVIVRGWKSRSMSLRTRLAPNPTPTSRAAMKIVLERTALKKDDRLADFLTDAYATVGIAYHRAAGVYTMDKEMQELGTAAVHLLTIATSYTDAQKNEGPV